MTAANYNGANVPCLLRNAAGNVVSALGSLDCLAILVNELTSDEFRAMLAMRACMV